MSWYESDMNWWWNLRNIWSNLTHPFTRVFWWIIKSAQYSWFLRGDFDWDYSYILLLLQYKLKRTRKRILDNNIILRSEEVAAQIKHAEDLIQNWHDHNWCEDLQKAHEEKWGDTVDLSEPIDVNGKTIYTWDMSREKATTPELKDQEKKEQRVIYQAMEDAEQQNYDELFSHLRKHIQEWWD